MFTRFEMVVREKGFDKRKRQATSVSVVAAGQHGAALAIFQKIVFVKISLGKSILLHASKQNLCKTSAKASEQPELALNRFMR